MVEVECRDSLALRVPLAQVEAQAWSACEIAPGVYTITATTYGCIPVTERFFSRPGVRELVVELVLRRAPTVKIFWRTETGEGFREALKLPDLPRDDYLVCVGILDREIAPGDPVPLLRNGYGLPTGVEFFVSPETIGRMIFQPPWHAAPADAVAELRLDLEPPVWVFGAVDETVAAVLRVDEFTFLDPASPPRELVLQTSLDLIRSLDNTVRVRIEDGENSSPMFDARASCRRLEYMDWQDMVLGADGHHTVSLPGVGTWQLRVTAPGRAQFQREFRTKCGEDLDLGIVRLKPPASIDVCVRDRNGRVIPGVFVVLRAPGDRSQDSGTRIQTDDSGLGHFTGISPGPCFIGIDDPFFASEVMHVEAVPENARAVVELRARPGTRVAIDVGSNLCLRQRLFVFDANGNLVKVVDLPAGGLIPIQLAPGDYTVDLENRGTPRAISVTDESVVYDLR
jgi:hypothetical protein